MIDPASALPPLPDPAPACDWCVIGAGIVGVTIAWQLARQGARVLLIDREGLAAGASRGNAGAYAFSDIQPLASPGILRQVPRWLLDPLGPLALRPTYLPRLAPWLFRFWRSSRPARVAASTTAQVALMALARAATHRLLDALALRDAYREQGNLHLYASQAAWRASLPGWQLRADHGIGFEHLRGAEAIARFQPGLSERLTVATFVPGWATIDDPLALVQRIAAAARACGAALHRADARALQPEAGAVRVPLQDGRRIAALGVVVAAGPWSHQLTATLGEPLPLETERGYNTTLPPGAFELRCQLTFPDHGFVVTPVGGGVRIGGAVELAGLDAAPNFRRAEAMLALAQRFLPALNAANGSQWMGHRPSLPDSLPVIDRSRADARVLYAFGHGHLGLTQSAATAELIAALAFGRAPLLGLEAFSVRRFARR